MTTGEPAPAMVSAKAPAGPGKITLVGVVLALVTIALGLVGIRDALVSADVLDGGSWIEGGIDRVDGLEAQWWMVPVGALLVIAGLWLLWTAVRRRPRRAAAVRSGTGVFLRPRDLRLLARRAAEDVDGVIDADAKASRKSVRVAATVTADDGHIADDIRASVQAALSVLDPVPRVRVRTDAKGLS
jgi:hypothetical protein